jgi:hypothetical protein
MSDIGGFDLSMLRKDTDVMAGFSVSNGLYQFKVKHPETGEMATGQMPVLDINYTNAAGGGGRLCVPMDSCMALISVVSEWSMKVMNTMSQGAPPPEPPSGR